MSDNTELLFSYGTLQQESVQRDTFGRRLDSQPDAIEACRVRTVRIDDEAFAAASGTAHHRTLEFTGDRSDCVDGAVLSVTAAELQQADNYEPACYRRSRVRLRSGLQAWVFAHISAFR